MQTVRVTPVVGLPQFTGWSQVLDHAISPDVHLVCALAVEGENAGSVGRESFSQILEAAPETGQGLYQFLDKLVGDAQAQGCSVSLAAGLFEGDSCYCAAVGGTVLLKRESKIGILLRADSELVIMGGKARLTDVFVFVTQQAEQFLHPIELQFQKGFDVDGVITGVVPAVHALEDSSLCALAFVTAETKRDMPVASEFAPGYIPAPQATSFQSTPPFQQNNTISHHAPQSAPISRAESTPGTLVRRKSIFDWLKPVGTKLQKISSSKTYVDAQVSKRTSRWFLIVAIIIGLIAALVFFWILTNRRAEAKALALVTPYTQELEQVEAQAQNDPIPARENASLIVENLTKLQTEKKESGSKQEQAAVDEVLNRAQALYTAISGRDEFFELPIFYDLRLAAPDFVTSIITIQGNTGIFTDPQKNQLIILNLQNKQVIAKNTEVVANLRAIAPWDTENAVLLGAGVFEVALTAEATPKEVIKEGDSNREATLINSFGPYVYVFNPAKRNIYRYVAAKDTFSEPVGWLQDPLGVEFASVTSFMVDGDVWISTNAGDIKKFTAGRSEDFKISGLPEVFDNPIWLFTNEKQTNLYVLDPAKRRLVILTKQGQFLREVKSNSLASATSLFVDEALQKAFVVSGSIVYEIAL